MISPTPDAVSCELGGEAVILNMATGRYYTLDPIGTRIWQILQTPGTVDLLCERILAEYEVGPDQCRTEVSLLLNDMAANGLLQFEDASGPAGR